MNEPAARRPALGESLEKSVEELLAAARPLPFGDEMIIQDLGEEEERVFLEAVLSA